MKKLILTYDGLGNEDADGNYLPFGFGSGVATPGPSGPVPGYQKFYKFLTLL